MDPTIFSQWFIRTPAKMTDLQVWKDHAFYMWVSLHLNLSSIRHDNAPSFYYQNGYQGIFDSHSNGHGWKRENLLRLFDRWLACGVTRPTAVSGKNLPSSGFGPRLEDIRGMRRDIEQLCSNPRIAQRLKTEESEIYQAFKLS